MPRKRQPVSEYSKRYGTVQLKRELVERVQKVVLAGIGYRSVTEFVAEATRLHLAEIEPLLYKVPRPQLVGPPAGGMRVGEGGPTWGDEPQPGKEEAGGGKPWPSATS